MNDVLIDLIKQFMPFAKKKMGFSRPPRLFLRQDEQNAADPLGRTGFYNVEEESITLYTTGRHPKDILRSLAHELQHHTQKCNGEFDNIENMGEEGYAQNNPQLRAMEFKAYMASMCVRDFEDGLKLQRETIYYEHLQKGDNVSMSTKNWKNQELKSLLAETWGFKMNLDNLNESAEDVVEEEEEIEEQTKTDRPDRVAGRDTAGRRLDEDGDECADEEGEELMEDDEVVEEDFPGKRDMEQHRSDLSEDRLKEIIAHALKVRG